MERGDDGGGDDEGQIRMSLRQVQRGGWGQTWLNRQGSQKGCPKLLPMYRVMYLSTVQYRDFGGDAGEVKGSTGCITFSVASGGSPRSRIASETTR